MPLQLVFGLSPFASGLLTFASAAGAMLMKVTAPPIIRRLGFRTVLIGNGILSAFIMMSYALFSPTTAHYVIVLALLTGDSSARCNLPRSEPSPMPTCPTRR